MPIICFRKKLKINNYEETISLAFNCVYDENNHLKFNNTLNSFDSGNIRIKIDELVNKLTYDLLLEYDKNNKDVRYLSILNYFYDNIPELYSIKFESNDGDSIYYISDLNK